MAVVAFVVTSLVVLHGSTPAFATSTSGSSGCVQYPQSVAMQVDASLNTSPIPFGTNLKTATWAYIPQGLFSPVFACEEPQVHLNAGEVGSSSELYYSPNGGSYSLCLYRTYVYNTAGQYSAGDNVYYKTPPCGSGYYYLIAFGLVYGSNQTWHQASATTGVVFW